VPNAIGMTNTVFPEGFILLDFSKWPQLEKVLFWFVAIFYTMIIFGNLTIIVLACIDPRLYTPSFFFLSNLSSLELCFTTTIVPQMSNLWGPEKTITYTGYVIQLCVFLLLKCTLLVVMAFDRYVAVCQKLALTAWLSGLMQSLIQSPITLQLSFCAYHHVDDFLSEVPTLIHLACGDTSSNGWQLTISAILFTILPVGLILTSYGYIAQAVGKIKSEEWRQKAIATCSSHLLVVFMFYGTVAIVYTDPKNDFASKHGNFFTFFYTVTPLLNPLIYTLRNKEAKEALLRWLIKGFSKQQ
uniref:G-protein coupled receptors family 1 profile domain-containing protein n=1 Tax=Loxodonta africana TaxID=9785 RepID=G3UD44_LOXAF